MASKFHPITCFVCALALVACSGDDEDEGPPDASADAAADENGGLSDGSTTDTVVGPGNAGDACESADDCEAPAGGECLDEIDPFAPFASIIALLSGLAGSGALPIDGGFDAGALPDVSMIDLTVEAKGGYCSAECTEDADCGIGSACLSFEAIAGPLLEAFGMGGGGGILEGILGGGGGICLKPCTADGDCREDDGYMCRGPFDGIDLGLAGADAGVPDGGIAGGLGGILPMPLFCLPPPPEPVGDGMDGGS